MIVRFSRWQERGRVRNHSRWPARRRRGGRASLVAAEVLETRLLLSADHLLFDPSNATTATAGNSFNLTVDVQNRRNRFDTGNHDAIRLSGGPLSGQVNARVSGGTADFDGLEIDKAGRYTILARDLTTGARATMFLTVTADTSDPEHLVFLHAPTSGTAGLTLGRLEVAVEDQFGNINRTNNGDPITLAVASPTGATLSAGPTTNPVNTVGGVAYFSGVIFDTAGQYTLGASDSNPNVPNTAETKVITVGSGLAAQLGFDDMTQINGTVGQALQDFSVHLEDANGNPVAESGVKITLHLTGGPSNTPQFAPGSTTTATTDANGDADFSNVIIDIATWKLNATASLTPTSTVTPSAPYALTASAGKLTSATGPQVTITVPQGDPVTSLTIADQPLTGGVSGPGASGHAVSTFAVEELDQYGNIVTTDTGTGTVTLALNFLTGSGVTSGSFDSSGYPAGFALGTYDGVVVYPGVVIDNNVATPATTYGWYTITATSNLGGVSQATSVPFQVTGHA